jgi:hypothetical protein
MIKVLFAVIALIAAAMVAGVYFSFNPVIFIFIILGFGLYMVTRIGGPVLPADAPIMWGSGHGIYIRSKVCARRRYELWRRGSARRRRLPVDYGAALRVRDAAVIAAGRRPRGFG